MDQLLQSEALSEEQVIEIYKEHRKQKSKMQHWCRNLRQETLQTYNKYIYSFYVFIAQYTLYTAHQFPQCVHVLHTPKGDEEIDLFCCQIKVQFISVTE